MKPRLITAILLFVSGYSPLFLIMTIKDFSCQEKFFFKHPVLILALIIFSIISIVLLLLSIRLIDKGSMSVQITGVKGRSVDLINYTIPYVVSFFGFDLAKIEDILSLMAFLFLMLLMTIKSKSVFMNPILLIAGYNLYDVDYEFEGHKNSVIVLSKADLNVGDFYFVRSLTKFLYIVTEKEVIE